MWMLTDGQNNNIFNLFGTLSDRIKMKEQTVY